MNPIHYKNGYITLMGTLVAGAIVSALVISLVFFSLSNAQINITLYNAYRAKALANLCAEEALQILHDSPQYIGVQNLDFQEEGFCHFTLSDLGEEKRLIQVVGQKDQVLSRAEIRIAALYPQIQLSSWQDVADF